MDQQSAIYSSIKDFAAYGVRLTPTRTNRVYVLYHADCMDGMFAALVTANMLRALASRSSAGDPGNIFCEPVRYNEDPPEMREQSNVIVVDFSYSSSILTNLARVHKSILVIDHHIKATQPLVAYAESYRSPKDTVPFDVYMTHLPEQQDYSGTGLAVEFANAIGAPVDNNADFNKFVRAVQHHDLWRHGGSIHDQALWLNYWFSFANTQAKQKLTVASLRWLVQFWGYDACIVLGRQILDEAVAEIRERIRTQKYRTELNSIGVYVCPAPHKHASLHGQLMAEETSTPFSITYDDRDPARIEYSLRTPTGSSYDMGDLAKVYGGGGHRYAAGFVSDKRPEELFPLVERGASVQLPLAQRGLIDMGSYITK